MEKRIDGKNIYDGKIIRVVLDDVELDDGSRSKREVVYHNGGACIAMRAKDGNFYLVKQYRYAVGKDMLEFCAGKIEIGEDPKEAILREAQEELGFSVKNLQSFGYIIPTCGYCSEKIYLYYGEEDEAVGQHLDDNERIDLFKYSYADIEKMIIDGQIDDGKTVALMYRIKVAGLNV